MVSTLFTVVGVPYRPLLAGKGGLSLGWPFFPSKLSSRAVSSPHMYAPAPRCKNISKSQPDLAAFFPINPASYASSIAF